MSNKLFESNWLKAKQVLCEGNDLRFNQDGSVNPNKVKMMNTILENTRNAMLNGPSLLMETASAGGTNAANIATLNKVILPVIRRVMPTVIANEIIGVQPMQGPVAQIHTLRIRYADSIPGQNIYAGTEALSPFDIYKSYTGNMNEARPGAAPTSYLEGTPGNRISIQILKETVEAKSRRLSARWTIEAAQDAEAQQGIDIQSEIMAALAQEITAEIDQEILGNLRRLPGAPSTIYDQSKVSGVATFVGDEHAALAILINMEANNIAARTRRGPGNWAVVSPTALTILQSATTSTFARTTEGVLEAPTNTKYVGTLNSSMRVYVDQFASTTTPVLIGYKGTGELDAACYYCPYVPLTSSGIVTDPQTFEPVVSFLTRYGFLELTNSANSFGNSSDYLGLIGIKDIVFM